MRGPAKQCAIEGSVEQPQDRGIGGAAARSRDRRSNCTSEILRRSGCEAGVERDPAARSRWDAGVESGPTTRGAGDAGAPKS
ncbi:hypothetical protein [Paenibacillus antibioticophila]|uniref:hypothetical protein n=1 Tax=Paenibacillus antibioticophila TaxID=1274374 RepID=UPI001BB4611E|nr:hypothetical protein [Paenibacillus antibioticophila]